MFSDDFDAVAIAAGMKVELLKKNPVGYFVMSMLAGLYIGFGILLIFSIGGLLAGSVATKVVMGAAVGVALSLVIIAGAELFTGNNFLVFVRIYHKWF